MDIMKNHPYEKSDSHIYLIYSPWQRNCYIGETKDLFTRFNTHIYHSKSHKKKAPLYNILRRSGVQNFSFFSIPIHPSIRKIMEKKLILHFQPSMNVKYRTKMGEIRRSKYYCSTNSNLRFRPLV